MLLLNQLLLLFGDLAAGKSRGAWALACAQPPPHPALPSANAGLGAGSSGTVHPQNAPSLSLQGAPSSVRGHGWS